MIKRLSLLRRREGLTRDAFAQHWSGPHARIALQMGGIAKYTQNRVRRLIVQRTDAQGAFDIDGVVELYFHDAAAMDRASESPVVRTLLPEDEFNFLSGITLTLPETVGVSGDGSLVKVMVVLSRAHDADVDSFKQEVERWLDTLPHVQSTVRDWIGRTMYRPVLWHDPVDPEAVLSFWVAPDGLTEFEAAVEASLNHVRGLGRASAYEIDPLRIV